MVVVHRMFAYLFTDAPQLVRAVAAGDARRASVVGAHVAEIANGFRRTTAVSTAYRRAIEGVSVARMSEVEI
jgi:hypothetical protein